MSTHNICFYGELSKTILQLSSNTLLICSTENTEQSRGTQQRHRQCCHQFVKGDDPLGTKGFHEKSGRYCKQQKLLLKGRQLREGFVCYLKVMFSTKPWTSCTELQGEIKQALPRIGMTGLGPFRLCTILPPPRLHNTKTKLEQRDATPPRKDTSPKMEQPRLDSGRNSRHFTMT